MQQKLAETNAFFDAEIAACARRGGELRADSRADEANFEKIKANVYGIFRTVLSVAAEHCKTQEEVRDFVLLRIRQIPESWGVALEKATQHGDGVRVQLERLKLDTASKIERKFREIWEVTA